MPGSQLMQALPDAYLGNGLTAEMVAERYGVSREEQDRFALESHRRALAAQAEGRFDAELVPVRVTRRRPGDESRAGLADGGHPAGVVEESFLHSVDEGPRADTTLEALASLRPAFRVGGSVTAGNSSQMSDGAAVTVLMSGAKAASLGLQPLGRFLSFAAVGVDPGVMGIGPVAAIPKALKLAALSLEEMGLVELNEAFASQALYVIRELGLDPERVNVNGGAIALGHPLGCTGAKLTATLLHEMKRRGERYGVVSMCVAGGMGAAAVFEG
jgi:acetyl-CoA acyltransferase